MKRNRQRDIIFHALGSHRVRVIVARSVEATAHRLGAPGMVDTWAVYIHADADRKTGTPHGWIVLGPEPDEATVAHEASHAVRAMFILRGIRNDEETYAYHLDFLVGRIHRFLKGQR
jgi:hypothetical protein